jgi:uncharacterized protein (DUF3820 family)
MTTEDAVMPFGPHQGKTLDNVPADYLRWVTKQNWSPSDVWGNKKMRELIPAIKQHLATRIDSDQEVPTT